MPVYTHDKRHDRDVIQGFWVYPQGNMHKEEERRENMKKRGNAVFTRDTGLLSNVSSIRKRVILRIVDGVGVISGDSGARS